MFNIHTPLSVPKVGKLMPVFGCSNRNTFYLFINMSTLFITPGFTWYYMHQVLRKELTPEECKAKGLVHYYKLVPSSIWRTDVLPAVGYLHGDSVQYL